MTASYAQYKADNKAILFGHFDKDGNGRLDVKELKDFIDLLQTGPLAGSPLIEVITKADLDANGDGAITFDEFWASVIKTRGYENEDAMAEDFNSKSITLEDYANFTNDLQRALKAGGQ